MIDDVLENKSVLFSCYFFIVAAVVWWGGEAFFVQCDDYTAWRQILSATPSH